MPGMGRVHEIVVENFKSYEGRVQIGPFRKFTCVIGPNGAGKSNLMDAMSFVLGVQARQLRSERLRDLVYRREGEDPKKNERIASVELTYMGSGAEDSVDNGPVVSEETLVFKRLILRSGEGTYQVNGENVSKADYFKRLESINVLSKVRNFLVFQGDVEATAQRQGKDLTAFFEQISGSETFREEYERLASEKGNKEDNARYLFTKKRNALNERKRVSQQKEEADQYRRLEAEQRDLQREFYLFRLHGIAQQLEAAGEGRSAIEGERDGLQAAMEDGRKGLEVAERERAQVHLQGKQAERAVQGARAKLDKLNPEHVAARTRVAFLKKLIEELKENASKSDTKRGKLAAQASLLKEEEAKLANEEAALKEVISQRELCFTKQQQEEFDRVKKDTEKTIAANSDNLRRLEHQVRGVAAERRRADQDRQEALARRDHLRQRTTELAEAEAAAQKMLAQGSFLAQERGTQLDRKKVSLATSTDEKEQLQIERQQLLDKIQDITATEKQLEREREVAKVCANLAEVVPGVYGRVVDLCRPTQKRLHIAVNVALGKFLDAVIVQSSETAHLCVRYLKERMLAPMTFLPLADLRCSPLDPRLEELVNGQHNLRLALNCVSFDERFARAFEFLLGDIIVADTMADGRRVAFGEARNLGIRCKFVTLLGEAIAKNGNLSVNSEATREGATRFDLSELDSTKSRLEAIDRQIHDLHAAEAAASADMLSLQEEVRRSENKANEAHSRHRWCQEQLRQKTDELQNAEAALGAAEPEAERLAKAEGKLCQEQREMERRVGQTVKAQFAKLSEAMGVDDVQRTEREWRREREAAQEKADENARRLRNVRAELSMFQQTLEEEAANSPEELVPKMKAEIESLSKNEAKLSKSVEAAEAELGSLEGQKRACVETEREKDKLLLKLRAEAKEKRQQLMAVEKRISDLGSEEQALRDSRTDLLRRSVLEDIEVPLHGCDLEALQDIAEAPSQPASAPTQRPPAAGANVQVDFAALPPEKQAASTGPAAKMLEEEYRTELDRLRVELRRLSPNLKAIDQMQDVAEHVQVASNEADVARKEIEDIDSQFEAVRKARKDRFLDCFQKVAGEISAVYRRLTANTAGLHADGGSAYLDLEDTEDPFNGGIKFTAMPPAKRFRDMHLLSGGEKTLAAMALLFAVHAYQRPPFMVLDEVDAALDANNVRSLAGYVEQAECQTIVVTHKERFYVRGESLVGVWKNKPQETSAVLTLDLTKYLPGQAQ